MAVDNPQEMIGSQLCDNKSLHLTPLRSAGEFRVVHRDIERDVTSRQPFSRTGTSLSALQLLGWFS